MRTVKGTVLGYKVVTLDYVAAVCLQNGYYFEYEIKHSTLSGVTTLSFISQYKKMVA